MEKLNGKKLIVSDIFFTFNSMLSLFYVFINEKSVEKVVREQIIDEKL